MSSFYYILVTDLLRYCNMAVHVNHQIHENKLKKKRYIAFSIQFILMKWNIKVLI